MRNALNVISGVTLALAACRPVKQVTALGKDIGQEFRRPIVVSINGRSHLVLVIPPQKDSTRTDTTDPASLARQIAVYAVKHYEHTASLKDVTVIFDAGDDSSSFGNYTWGADDLSGKTKPPVAGTPVEKSD